MLHIRRQLSQLSAEYSTLLVWLLGNVESVKLLEVLRALFRGGSIAVTGSPN